MLVGSWVGTGQSAESYTFGADGSFEWTEGEEYGASGIFSLEGTMLTLVDSEGEYVEFALRLDSGGRLTVSDPNGEYDPVVFARSSDGGAASGGYPIASNGQAPNHDAMAFQGDRLILFTSDGTTVRFRITRQSDTAFVLGNEHDGSDAITYTSARNNFSLGGRANKG